MYAQVRASKVINPPQFEPLAGVGDLVLVVDPVLAHGRQLSASGSVVPEWY